MQYVAYRVFAMECVVFAISKVSIHAPARGAIFSNRLNFVRYCFNSRTREGCDYSGINRPHIFGFQFTHPRGVRYVTTAAINSDSSFNSRTREGCDNGKRLVKRKATVSIHAPARGAMTLNRNNTAIRRFQFTHPRGVRCIQ